MKRFWNIARKVILIIVAIVLLIIGVAVCFMIFPSSKLAPVIHKEKKDTSLPTKVIEYAYKDLDGQDKRFKVTLVGDEFVEKSTSENKAFIQQDSTNIYVLVNNGEEGFGSQRIISIKKQTGEQAELVATGDLKSPNTDAFLNNVGYLTRVSISSDRKELYVTENFGGPGNNVIVFDLQANKIRESSCSGALYGTVDSGPFKGYILVDTREHTLIGNEPYYIRSLVNPKNCLVGIPLGIMPESY